MPAYVIADVEVQDSERYEDYKRMAAAAVAQAGGRFVVRGGRAETLEGGWSPRRIVVLEFESFEAAERWWASEEYAPAKALRQATAESRMIVVEGV